MKLSFKKEFQSINIFMDTDLPNLAVITGLNGTGKSHLLQAINNGSITIDKIDKNKIIFFNNSSFSLPHEGITNAKQLEEEYALILDSFKRIRISIKALTDKFNDYEDIKNMSLKIGKSFIELIQEDFSEKDDYTNYNEFIKNYKTHLSNLTIKLPDKYSHTSYGISLVHLASKISYSIHELNDTEFKTLFVPYVFTNFLLPSELGKTFWDYYLKYDHNKYLEYINSTKSIENKVLTYSDEEFIQVYGEKPWVVINEILENFDSIDYKVNSPEGLFRDDSYQYKLVNNQDNNISISHANLSSGERILMALVGLVYRLRLDNNLPDLILFDEVDASLHPSMIKMFLNVIQDTLISIGKKVILVTHSPSMVALAPEESIYLMNKIGSNRLEKKSKGDALSILTEGYATLNQGLKLFDEIGKARISIITEGNNTRLIEKAFNLLGCNNVEVISNIENISGKNQLKTLFEFFSKIIHENKVIFVWDCDVAYKLTNSNNTFPYILKYNSANTIAAKGIENMFPTELFDDYIKTITLSTGKIIKEFDSSRKRDFESFVIKRNKKEDFVNFQHLVDKIKSI